MEGSGFSACRPPRVFEAIQLKDPFLSLPARTGVFTRQRQAATPEAAAGRCHGISYSGNKLHPTQKPVAALARLIRSFTTPGELVLDAFCGSGSTCAAGLLTGRK